MHVFEGKITGRCRSIARLEVVSVFGELFEKGVVRSNLMLWRNPCDLMMVASISAYAKFFVLWPINQLFPNAGPRIIHAVMGVNQISGVVLHAEHIEDLRGQVLGVECAGGEGLIISEPSEGILHEARLSPSSE